LEGGQSLVYKIALDAGHGGTDNGASGNGIHEKDITLKLIQAIDNKLKSYKDVQTLQTRPKDEFVGLTERCNISNNWKADVFLSCHINAATDINARGWQSHIYSGNIDARTVAYQNVIHENVIQAIKKYNVTDRGKDRNDFAVLRQTDCVAILTENLFITNSADATLLKDDAFIESVAEGHVIGLEKFLGLEKNNIPPPVSPDLYQVIAGTFSSLDNANKLLAKLKAQGYDAYVNKK
jgi:N-acetylmuramoyl-L-alanine amidase